MTQKDMLKSTITHLRTRLKYIKRERRRNDLSFAVRYQLWDEEDEIVMRIAVKRVREEHNKQLEYFKNKMNNLKL